MDLRAWFDVFTRGPLRLVVKLLAPLAYPFIDKWTNPIWGINDTDDFSFWNVAIRNGAHNFSNRKAVKYTTKSNTIDFTLEQLQGLQWRYRRSLDGRYVSFRVTWGKPRRQKGKKEFYIGWTMNETEYMRLAFFQFRPF